MNKTKLALMFGGLVALGASALPAHAELSVGTTTQADIHFSGVLPKVTLNITPASNLQAGEIASGTTLADLEISTIDGSQQILALLPDDTTFKEKIFDEKSMAAKIHSETDPNHVIGVRVGSKEENVVVQGVEGHSYLMTNTALAKTSGWNISTDGLNNDVAPGSYPVLLTAYSYKN
ncbi:hypothetical protein FOT62_24825 [Serratia marcescens]|uniref:Fimbrial protein n=1 Tax=Serratia marcescens TaxID=615 RepID=A0A5C7BKS3_SERMA|nr:hypothetical protein [Serratia marcescens]TXE24300.1 hypothetical protein FOT62_24825 [Serratia marcescens]TXE53293.1 hypothetical protein FOT56_27275 [Serratia marcescens]